QAPGRAIHGDPPCAGAHGPGARAVRRMGASAGSGPMRPGTAATAGGLLLAVALMALNLRPFIAGIGPLAADIAQDTGLGLKGVALLTLVPMLLMGVFAFAGPWLQARIGARRAVVAALVLLALGSLLRLFTQ